MSVISVHSNSDDPDSFVNRLQSEKETWRTYGNHRVFCNNRIIVGPVRSWWWILEIYTIVITIIFVCEYEKQVSIYITIAGVIGFIICFASSWKTLLCDPGIVKRESFEQAMLNAAEVERMIKSGISHPTKTVSIDGESVKFTYCLDCHIFRPPNTGHCHDCDCCVEGWDHHCPVFGGCVAKNNLVSFHIMAMSLAFYHVSILVSGIAVVIGYAKRYGQNHYSNLWFASITLDVSVVAYFLACILPVALSSLPCEQEKPRRRPFNRWIWNQNSTYRSRTVHPSTEATGRPKFSSPRPSKEGIAETDDSNGNNN